MIASYILISNEAYDMLYENTISSITSITILEITLQL